MRKIVVSNYGFCAVLAISIGLNIGWTAAALAGPEVSTDDRAVNSPNPHPRSHQQSPAANLKPQAEPLRDGIVSPSSTPQMWIRICDRLPTDSPGWLSQRCSESE